MNGRHAGETDDQYKHRLARALRAGVRPGSLIQFWRLVTDFENMRNRANASETATSYGHSPVFEAYQNVGGVPRALQIIDQAPPSLGTFKNPARVQVDPNTAANLRISWDGRDEIEDLWIAADWNE